MSLTPGHTVMTDQSWVSGKPWPWCQTAICDCKHVLLQGGGKWHIAHIARVSFFTSAKYLQDVQSCRL